MRLAAVVLMSLTFTLSAGATECPDPPPFHPCEPYAYEKIYYEDETKTVVVGSWTWTCPNIDTCINQSSSSGTTSPHFDLYCFPCEGCRNCQHLLGNEDEESATISSLEGEETPEPVMTCRRQATR
jgi:hypothetical protein